MSVPEVNPSLIVAVYEEPETGDVYKILFNKSRYTCLKVTAQGETVDIQTYNQIPPKIRAQVFEWNRNIISPYHMPPRLESAHFVYYHVGGCGHNST